MLLYKSGLTDYPANSLNSKKVKLADLTTYGLGGYANSCYFPQTPYQAKLIYENLKKRGEKIIILGNGSNLLAADSDFNGSVICLRNMQGIVRLDETRILCLAGTKISTILKYCKSHSLSGIEYMFGIPASIGGAAFMNAGVGESTISRNIVNIRYFGDICGVISAKKCNFSRKYSTMRDTDGVILAVALQLALSSPQEISQKIDYYKNKRAHLPKGKSCGCVFVNGENYFSGELIDKCGLKGYRCGGAYISNEHANFIINDGGTSSDVKELIDLAKQRVKLKFGVQLQEEVVYIGDFNDFNG